jgi:nucleoside-diphosphate-sugar epimerase
VYLSSTRIYAAAPSATEDQALPLEPANPSDLYNLSKAMGEAIALHSGADVRIARLANVYGPDWGSENFLTSLIRAAARDRRVTFGTSARSAKDYVSVHDVVEVLIRMGTASAHRIYNVASGVNVTNEALAARLAAACGCSVQFAANAPDIRFPPIPVNRIRAEFGISPRSIVDDLGGLVVQYLKQGSPEHDHHRPESRHRPAAA